MEHILIVEDEQDIRELLAFHLEKQGYGVLQAEDGKTGLSMARQHLPSLILLDVMLPGMDGLEVCKELERDATTAPIPIIMVTAKGEDIDRILGLELGADDYVVKPFNIRELLLRIRAILRRQVQAQAQPLVQKQGVFLDPSAHRVVIDGKNVELTATEFRLLEDLMRHAGKVRTREQLLSGVWGYEFEGYARTVDTHVRRLRSKMGSKGENVETVRGIGYRFREEYCF